MLRQALPALALLVCLTAQAAASPLPRDESVDAYITMVLENFAEAMKTGIPALGMPVLDPYDLPADLALPQVNSSLMDVSGNASSMTLSGTSSFTPAYVHLDVPAGTFDLQLSFVGIMLDGQYWADGLLAFLLPVFGEGRILLDVRGLNVTTSMAVTVSEDGHLQIPQLHLLLSVEQAIVAFESILGGGSFSLEVNEALTAFATYLANTALPLVDTQLVPIIQNLLNEFFLTHTIKDIIQSLLPGHDSTTVASLML